MIAATHAVTWKASTSVSQSQRWGTPPGLYLSLDREFNFTLDAAADPGNAKHVRYLTKDTDALAVSWAGERVFCNPPYGRELSAWLEKAIIEASEGGALTVFLLPARTGNRWFHRHVLPWAEVRFLEGRYGFKLGDVAGRAGRAPFDSMVVIYRPWCKRKDHVPEHQVVMPFLPRVVP